VHGKTLQPTRVFFARMLFTHPYIISFHNLLELSNLAEIDTDRQILHLTRLKPVKTQYKRSSSLFALSTLMAVAYYWCINIYIVVVRHLITIFLYYTLFVNMILPVDKIFISLTFRILPALQYSYFPAYKIRLRITAHTEADVVTNSVIIKLQLALHILALSSYVCKTLFSSMKDYLIT